MTFAPPAVVVECAECARPFKRRTTMNTICSLRCVIRQAKRAEAAEHAETKSRLAALKPRSKWLAEAQAAFNRFIRARDAHLPCISCGKPAAGSGSWDAGHYLTRGARPELRFNEDNVHRQCVRCNQHLHGNPILYRLGLIARRGLAVVEALEGPHPPAKLSIDDLRALIREYRARTRQLRAAIESTQEEGTAP